MMSMSSRKRIRFWVIQECMVSKRRIPKRLCLVWMYTSMLLSCNILQQQRTLTTKMPINSHRPTSHMSGSGSFWGPEIINICVEGQKRRVRTVSCSVHLAIQYLCYRQTCCVPIGYRFTAGKAKAKTRSDIYTMCVTRCSSAPLVFRRDFT